MCYNMKIKFYISFVLVVLSTLFAFGQDYNKYCLYPSYAEKAYTTKKYDVAIALMDTAILKCPEQANNEVNWFNLSLFYKSYYKSIQEHNLRSKMLESILTAKKLDVDNDLETPISKYLNSLAVYYYNDVAKITSDTTSDFKGALLNYSKYKQIKKITNPNLDFTKEDLNFYNTLAARNYTKYQNNKQLNENHLDSAIHYYKKSLELDSTIAATHNEIGLIYFNSAVDIIENLDDEADIMVTMQADDKKADLAVKGLPYFKKALSLDPNNAKILYGIAGCYEILNFNDEKNHYLSLLKEKDPDFLENLNSN